VIAEVRKCQLKRKHAAVPCLFLGAFGLYSIFHNFDLKKLK